MTFFKRFLLLGYFFLLLTGCSAVDKINDIFTGQGIDNTPRPAPLTPYTVASFSLMRDWTANIGNDSAEIYRVLSPIVSNGKVYAVDPRGSLLAINQVTGKTVWQKSFPASLSAAPAINEGSIVIATNDGILYALDQSTGNYRWKIRLSDPAITPPSIIDQNVIIKTLDGQLWNINLGDGQVRWHYSHTTPFLVLAGGSQPIINENRVFTGYADGKLAAYTLKEGQLIWITQIASPKGNSPVEQMIDITANPVYSRDNIYVVGYQANLAAYRMRNGQLLWKLPLSSYTGMTMSALAIFVTDATGNVWAIDRQNGQIIWRQNYLQHRFLTAPLLFNHAIIIADGEGYLHCLNQSDGKTIARVHVTRYPIVTPPTTVDNNIVILDNHGKLFKYSLKK